MAKYKRIPFTKDSRM